MLSLKTPRINLPNGLIAKVYEATSGIGAYSPRNEYLEGPYAPVHAERVDTDLTVIGEIPKELSGSYLRIGPNPLHVKNPANYHWFTGDGMVHSVKIKDGKFIWYRNKWVGTDRINDAFGRPRAPGLRHGTALEVNTNIIGHEGRIWAIVEAGALPVELNEQLDTLKHGMFDSDKKVPYSAHPHRDPETGELHTITYSPTQLNYIEYIVVDANHQVTKLESIPMSRMPMIHDCALTQKYILILDFPVLFSPIAAAKGARFPYNWKENSYARVGLMPRKGTAKDIVWLNVDEPCMSFHTCNAFDQDDGTVVMDLVIHPKTFPQGAQGPELTSTTFERWKLNPQTGYIDRKVISSDLQEFPRFDERLTTKPYRYAYTIDANPDFIHSNRSIFRHDVTTGETIARHFPTGTGTSEVNFVPRHADSAEDDGWLLTFVTDFVNNTTDFVILDAKDIQADPVASVRLPWQLPLNFHNNWVADLS